MMRCPICARLMVWTLSHKVSAPLWDCPACGAVILPTGKVLSLDNLNVRLFAECLMQPGHKPGTTRKETIDA
jgi:hypothetical protein